MMDEEAARKMLREVAPHDLTAIAQEALNVVLADADAARARVQLLEGERARFAEDARAILDEVDASGHTPEADARTEALCAMLHHFPLKPEALPGEVARLRATAERVLVTHSLPQYTAQDHDEALDQLAAVLKPRDAAPTGESGGE